ncbi:MAG: hypothetical protein JXQ96_22990 [Cyclobacteriaceae bacterium]
MEIFQRKECLYCHEPIAGRLDKKFCGDQCRANYNNRHRKASETLILETNRQLRKNRTILKSLCPTGRATVRREVLAEMGFEFAVFTTIWTSKELVYYFCYEYGYAAIVEKSNVRKALIIQRQDYMTSFDPWKNGNNA